MTVVFWQGSLTSCQGFELRYPQFALGLLVEEADPVIGDMTLGWRKDSQRSAHSVAASIELVCSIERQRSLVAQPPRQCAHQVLALLEPGYPLPIPGSTNPISSHVMRSTTIFALSRTHQEPRMLKVTLQEWPGCLPAESRCFRRGHRSLDRPWL